ncbi:MAG: AbrB/MazE/SpoVT family DNA-binding domain-containing protein [Moheibacter sp.]
METNVIKVGNSKGIIIPAKFLKILNLTNKVKLSISENQIIISPVEKFPREDWEERIKADIEKNGMPELEFPPVFEDENLEEW